eukprot:TRINITY_DN2869_c2_g1_i1.p1 TRINITY_DN2869_c2_g1~~TRINITY_DN2869_c2_g1_i1.p1  ORF type:complete len:932 (-),score=278.22 TRINITY_DN2869_c2_g1_i1:173-2896(-)
MGFPSKRGREEAQAPSTSAGNFFGGGGYANFGHYMQEKQRKLKDQFAAVAEQRSSDAASRGEEAKPAIFKGLTFWMTGRTCIADSELKRLIFEHGGTYEQYGFTRVSHIIADNLASGNQSWRELRKRTKRGNVVTSSWVMDCVKEGKRLPEHRYMPKVLEAASTMLNFVAQKGPSTTASSYEGEVSNPGRAAASSSSSARTCTTPAVPAAAAAAAAAQLIPTMEIVDDSDEDAGEAVAAEPAASSSPLDEAAAELQQEALAERSPKEPAPFELSPPVERQEAAASEEEVRDEAQEATRVSNGHRRSIVQIETPSPSPALQVAVAAACAAEAVPMEASCGGVDEHHAAGGGRPNWDALSDDDEEDMIAPTSVEAPLEEPDAEEEEGHESLLHAAAPSAVEGGGSGGASAAALRAVAASPRARPLQSRQFVEPLEPEFQPLGTTVGGSSFSRALPPARRPPPPLLESEVSWSRENGVGSIEGSRLEEPPRSILDLQSFAAVAEDLADEAARLLPTQAAESVAICSVSLGIIMPFDEWTGVARAQEGGAATGPALLERLTERAAAVLSVGGSTSTSGWPSLRRVTLRLQALPQALPDEDPDVGAARPSKRWRVGWSALTPLLRPSSQQQQLMPPGYRADAQEVPVLQKPPTLWSSTEHEATAAAAAAVRQIEKRQAMMGTLEVAHSQVEADALRPGASQQADAGAAALRRMRRSHSSSSFCGGEMRRVESPAASVVLAAPGASAESPLLILAVDAAQCGQPPAAAAAALLSEECKTLATSLSTLFREGQASAFSGDVRAEETAASSAAALLGAVARHTRKASECDAAFENYADAVQVLLSRGQLEAALATVRLLRCAALVSQAPDEDLPRSGAAAATSRRTMFNKVHERTRRAIALTLRTRRAHVDVEPL